VAGAKSVKDAVEGMMKRRTTLATAKQSKELKQALDKWGYRAPEEIRERLRTIDKNKKLFEQLIFKSGYEAIEILDKT
jgi:uncharacterized Fe-S cluster-containing radical SAM superfamily protein